MTKVTEEQLNKFAEATDNELYDIEHGWMTGKAEETADTLAAFEEASRDYNERTSPKHGEVAGFKYIAFEKVQVRKGDRRSSWTVIDFGDARIAIDDDITDYLD